MAGRLHERVAIVTGAASGIGRCTALTFAREGAVVVAADRNIEAAVAVVNEVKAAGGQAEGVLVDVSREGDVREMVDTVLNRFGRIDILVNNAGYGFAGSVVETSLEDWDAIMGVNVRGVFLACKYVIPSMEKAGGGVIVNTASTTAKVGIRDRAAYCATKGAVASLTRAMALDHVDANIRVNCVAPGTIESPYFTEIFESSPDAAALRKGLEQRQAMNRLGQPQEIADVILFLASDESSFCTGSMVTADGGWTAK